MCKESQLCFSQAHSGFSVSDTYTACSSSSPPMRWDMFFNTPMLPETSSNCSSCCSTIN